MCGGLVERWFQHVQVAHQNNGEASRQAVICVTYLCDQQDGAEEVLIEDCLSLGKTQETCGVFKLLNNCSVFQPSRELTLPHVSRSMKPIRA
jgi:hypothetical protein